MLSFNTSEPDSIQRLEDKFGDFRKVRGQLLADKFNLPPKVRKGVILNSEDLGTDFEMPALTPLITCRIDLPPSAKSQQYLLRGKNVTPEKVKDYLEEIMKLNNEAILICLEDSTVVTTGRYLPRWEYSGGATTMVDLKNRQAALEFVGPGFDASYLTRGKCVHHSFMMPFDLMKTPVSRLFDFNNRLDGRIYYRSDDSAYSVSRAERIDDLARYLTVDTDVKTLEESIPTTLPELQKEVWEEIYQSCLLPLVNGPKAPSALFGASINIYEGKPYVFEVWQGKDL